MRGGRSRYDGSISYRSVSRCCVRDQQAGLTPKPHETNPSLQKNFNQLPVTSSASKLPHHLQMEPSPVGFLPSARGNKHGNLDE